jgi:hypothetical protein
MLWVFFSSTLLALCKSVLSSEEFLWTFLKDLVIVTFQRLLNYGILRPCQSVWNTPLLPVQKPGTNDYRSVQDPWAVSQEAVTLHLVVLNPYTLLVLIPAEATCFSCLNLKDASFCIQLAPVSQPSLLSNGRTPPVGGGAAVNLDLSPTGLQKLPNHL